MPRERFASTGSAPASNSSVVYSTRPRSSPLTDGQRSSSSGGFIAGLRRSHTSTSSIACNDSNQSDPSWVIDEECGITFSSNGSFTSKDKSKSKDGERKKKKVAKSKSACNVAKSYWWSRSNTRTTGDEDTDSERQHSDRKIEMLTPKQNGTASAESADRDGPSSSSAGGKSSTKTSIRTMWKKAVKSMKPGEKTSDKAARSDIESSCKVGQDAAASAKVAQYTRQSSLKKGGLIKRKDSKEKDLPAALPDEDTEEQSRLRGNIDPVYSLLKCAADLPRQGGKGGVTSHACCPRGILALDTGSIISRSSSPASSGIGSEIEFSSSSTANCSCPCHTPELLEGYHTEFLNSFVIKKS